MRESTHKFWKLLSFLTTSGGCKGRGWIKFAEGVLQVRREESDYASAVEAVNHVLEQSMERAVSSANSTSAAKTSRRYR